MINFLLHFNPRFGPEPWLEPYTDETIIKLAKTGTQNLIVVSPGFVSDCLETLDEIKNEAKELFIENGGKTLKYINCLNYSPVAIKLYKDLIMKNLSGWC